jgi:hypothetical protein
MTDITSLNLEAALLDQIVAGTFHDKTYAYTSVIAKGGYQLAVAVVNEKGYCPIDGKTFDNWDEAMSWADSLNKHIGLSTDKALSIVVSTMGGRRYEEAT